MLPKAAGQFIGGNDDKERGGQGGEKIGTNFETVKHDCTLSHPGALKSWCPGITPAQLYYNFLEIGTQAACTVRTNDIVNNPFHYLDFHFSVKFWVVYQDQLK